MNARSAVAVIALMAVALGLVQLAGCVRDPGTPLRIGTNVWIGSEPLYLARDLGHLDAKRVRMVEYPSASEVLRAYRNQAIDGMVISLDELLGLAADGQHPRIVLVADVSHGADVVVGRPGMRTMQDLRGRKVAVESGAVGALVLSRALSQAGMAAGDVQTLHLDSNEQPDAFERGMVDGAVTFDPYRSRLLAAGATTLFDSSLIPGEIVDLVAIRETALASHRAAVRDLLAAWFRALDYIDREPLDAARRMGARQQLDAAAFLDALRLLRLPSREENMRMIGGESPTLATSGRRLMQLMLDARLLSAATDIERLLAPDVLLELERPR